MVRLSILIVEDHDALREVTKAFLQDCGHEVRDAFDAESMDQLIAEWPPEVVILDVNLPGEDGQSICRRLRASRPGLGIIMLTARTSAVDRVAGYDLGADVYLGKPTSNEELAAAVQSLGRRLKSPELAPGLTLDWAKRQIRGPLGAVLLSESEARVLAALATSPGRQLEYWQWLELLGMEDGPDAKAALEVRVLRLRRKLVQAGASEGALQTVRRVGYRFSEPLSVV